MRRFAVSWLLAGLGLIACGDDDAGSEERDAATGARDGGSRARDSGTGAPEPSDTGIDGAQTEAGALPVLDAEVRSDGGNNQPMRAVPTNTSFERAKRIEPDQLPVLQDQIAADQLDYFVFSGKRGEFFEIKTDRGTFMPDVVVSLYDAERERIAQNDSGSVWPGDRVDARLVVRLPADGDYYVEVDDPFTPEQFFSSSFPLLYYHLSLRALRAGAGVAIAQGSAPSTIEFAHDDRTGYDYVTLLGELGAETAVFDFNGGAAQALIGHVLPSGTDGNGSTAAGGLFDVVDADAHVLAHIDRQGGQSALDPPVHDAAYKLLVRGGSGELGDNAFYVLDLFMLPDNPREANEVENGALAGAEAIAVEGMFSRRGLLLVSLPEGDVDYFKIDAMEMESITAVCEGESGGSGVRAMTVELRDDSDQVLASATETSNTGLELEPFQVPLPGSYYIRISSSTPAAVADSADPWARCAVIVGF